MNKTRLIAFLLAFSLVLVLFLRLESSTVQTQSLDSDAVVLAFGDSLTYGYGAVTHAYPIQLQTLIGRKVVNAGVSGEVSANGLRRLPKLLEMYRPSLVILCHGGNDILRRTSKEKLKANLIAMIELSRKSGAQVLLVGVPGFGLLGLTTVELYEEVAREQNVLYEGSVLEMVEGDTSLKSDRIHPNRAGYKMMAEAFATVLRKNGVL